MSIIIYLCSHYVTFPIFLLQILSRTRTPLIYFHLLEVIYVIFCIRATVFRLSLITSLDRRKSASQFSLVCFYSKRLGGFWWLHPSITSELLCLILVLERCSFYAIALAMIPTFKEVMLRKWLRFFCGFFFQLTGGKSHSEMNWWGITGK